MGTSTLTANRILRGRCRGLHEVVRLPTVIALISWMGVGILWSAASAGSMPLRHPFIIIRDSEFDSLRARAHRQPWSVIKKRAIERAQTIRYRPGMSHSQKSIAVYNLGSACALAFIVDSAQGPFYIARVEQDVRRLLHEVRMTKEQSADPTDHGMSVSPAHAAFMTYLLLDIMYNGLDPTIRAAMEEDCDYIASKHHTSWWESKFAIEGMKALYHEGVSQDFLAKKNAYKDYLLKNTSDDGVYTTGPGYAYSRLYMEERAQKKIFMDICEHVGIHEFYSNVKLGNLYEWLFGYSLTPFGRTYTFGDSPPTKAFEEYSAAFLRVHRFSPRAERFAAWFLGPPHDESWKGGLLEYVFCPADVFPPEAPPSRIFHNGGAWLLQRQYSADALAGVLWNVSTVNESHNHFDANAMSIAGFGEHIFRNSGYDGWKEPDSATWEWIHRNAASSNTVLINGANHRDFRGGGITEGIVGLPVEYATGHSGPALGEGIHERSLVFVQPDRMLPGYFALMDEVRNPNGTGEVTLLLHPNADESPRVVDEGKEYDWRIKNCFTDKPIRAKVFLAQQPARVDVQTGYRASNESCNRYVGTYLRARYLGSSEGSIRLATILFPYLDGDLAFRARRLSLREYYGAVVALSDSVQDYWVAARVEGEVHQGSVIGQATFGFWRERQGVLSRYWVKQGRKLFQKLETKRGFESDAAVSLVMDQHRGEIVSQGSAMTFFLPGIVAVEIDGKRVSPLSQGAGYVQVRVSSGKHTVVLQSK